VKIGEASPKGRMDNMPVRGGNMRGGGQGGGNFPGGGFDNHFGAMSFGGPPQPGFSGGPCLHSVFCSESRLFGLRIAWSISYEFYF
jgi:hypothetical protein